MKRKIMLVALVLIFAGFTTQMLYAQKNQAVGTPACQIDDSCDPDPTPTPPPNPTPTPSSTPANPIGPKYVVVAVTYAPPGVRSFVTYTNSSLFGSTLSLSSSFSNTVSFQVVTEQIAKIFGTGAGSGITISQNFVQTTDTTLSIAATETDTRTYSVPGPSNSGLGIVHDADVIWLWLNPVFNFSFPSPTVLQWGSLGFDNRDPAGDLEIVPVPVAYLNGHQPMPQQLHDLLQRSWVCVNNNPECPPNGTNDPALSQDDFNAILATDPFTDPSYTVDMMQNSVHGCTSDGRYCLATVATFAYEPPPQGQQPITETFTETRQGVATEAVGVTTSVQETFSKTFFFTQQGFLSQFFKTLTFGDTLMLTNKISLTNNQQGTATALVSVTGPANPDNYTGPVELNVFQDNIYGTFMFGAIPATTFFLNVSPNAQTVAQAGCASYSATITSPVNGFNKTINFSVIGLPPGATGIFDSPMMTGTGVSHLTVCAAPSTPVGPSNLTITAASGVESHRDVVTLTVTDPFLVSISPVSQTVLRGGTASYTITVTPQSGFSGTVNLSASGAPAGANVTFSPASITGSGSSTLTITTTSSTALQTYSLTITGTSGSLSQSTTATLNVTSSAGAGDFTLNVSPGSQTVNAGDSAFYDVSSSALNGFTGAVALSAGGPGGDIFVDLSPSTIGANGSSTLTVTTSSTTAAGTYFITINGSSGTLSRSASVSITVNSSCLDRGICPLQ